MSVHGLTIIHSGTLTTDRGLLTFRTGLGTKVSFSNVCALLRTDDGYVLWDTGLHPSIWTDPASVLGEHRASCVNAADDEPLLSKLSQVNVAPDEIKYVINSHLHWDHTGGNCLFPRAEFMVQKAELQYAMQPPGFASTNYISEHFDLPVRFRLVNGSEEVLPGVFVFFTPGHTPGHQSLVVKLPRSGTFIFSGDVSYFQEDVERQIPPGNCTSLLEASASLSLLTTLARMTSGRLVITHDPGCRESLRAAPYWYE